VARTKKSLRARKQPSQERSRQTVAAILEAAVQVFAKHGYAAGTTIRIAERAGVSVGSLYQYFPNKDALLVALTERHIAQSHAGIRDVLEEIETHDLSLDAIVTRIVDAMVELHLVEPKLHRVLFEEIPKKAAIQSLKDSSEEALLARVERLLARHPEVNVRNTKLAALMVAQTVESLCHWYVLDAPPIGVSDRVFAREVTSLLCGYLRGASV
jgi:AcrR family transcriptional regulator